MFSAEDILDIAIRLEENGEKTYLKALEHTTDEVLRALLTWIAREEQNHARWFGQLKERLSQSANHHLRAELSRALAEDVIRGQAFSLQGVDFRTVDTPDKMVRTFIGFEDDTIAFYEILKALIDEAAIVGQLEQIIAEEKQHIAQFRELLSQQ